MESRLPFGNKFTDWNLSLAPMDGLSDQPFRFICKKMGASITYTEFINVLDVPKNLKYIDKRTCFTEFERPIGFQLYGNNPKTIFFAAQILSDKEPDFFDINLGCSVNRITGRGAGAGLLKEPETVKTIITKLVKEINIPITAKIRLGWDQDNLNYIELSRIIEGSGATMIAVHGRSRDQNWKDSAIWDPIREIKNTVNIPVIGNGDVRSQDDIREMIKQTGCDGVMIGRAAIGNPWIFSGEDKSLLSKQQIIEMIKSHWLLMLAFYGHHKTSSLYKKHLKAYLSCSQFSHVDIKKLISSPNSMNSQIFFN